MEEILKKYYHLSLFCPQKYNYKGKIYYKPLLL